MKDPQPQNNFKKLLNRLQEDSWQLELLVSGFAIFGLFYAFDAINNLIIDTSIKGNDFVFIIYQVASLSVLILLFNLILHVILRSLWIGALGLRYVSGDIRISDLRYSPKFTRYLTKKVGSFDNYIETLEKLSSLMFAISFLLVFYLLSFVLTVFIFAFLVNIKWIPISLWWLQQLIIFFFLIGALLTFIDFVTLGMLKKNKWVSAIYFPFYYLFSFFTLSFLYRPLFYNLIDNKFSRKVSLFLLPIYAILLTFSGLEYVKSNYVNAIFVQKSNEIVAEASSYADMVRSQKLIMDKVVIQSKIIREPYIQIHMPLSNYIEESILAFDTTLIPKIDQRGYKIAPAIEINMSSDAIKVDSKKTSDDDSLLRNYISAFNHLYEIQIDSIVYPSDFIIIKEQQHYMFEMCIDIKSLPSGRHVIALNQYHEKPHIIVYTLTGQKNIGLTQHLSQTSDSVKCLRKIPFWYYP